MKRLSRRNPVAVALYVNAGLLAAIFVAVLATRESTQSMLPAAFAQAQPAGIAGGACIASARGAAEEVGVAERAFADRAGAGGAMAGMGADGGAAGDVPRRSDGQHQRSPV